MHTTHTLKLLATKTGFLPKLVANLACKYLLCRLLMKNVNDTSRGIYRKEIRSGLVIEPRCDREGFETVLASHTDMKRGKGTK